MKPVQCFFCVTVISLLVAKKNFAFANNDTAKISADHILEKVVKKLNKFRILSYNYSYESKSFFPDDSYSTSASIVLDFSRKDTLLGLNYQIENAALKFIYNGTEMFILNKKLKTINGLTIKPAKEDISSLVFFQNSLITLRNGIPPMLLDKQSFKIFTDTLIDSKNYWIVSYTPLKKSIDPFGKSFSAFTINRNITYKIIIDKKTFLPYGIIQTFSDNNNYQKTLFSGIKEGDKLPELSWYYSTYNNDYRLVSQKERPALISTGINAPEWSLPSIFQNKSVSLNQLRGKFLLLEFWVVNCGYCVAAVSKINKLQSKFANKDIEFVGINLYDSKEKIAQFLKRYNPMYTVLYNGQDVADKYGVISYPKVVLIDKEGKVIYANSLVTDELESILDRTLK